MSDQPARVSCVGAVIRDAGRRLLLVRRGHEPGLGLWSVPGGRVEPGETDGQAVVREVREETGLEVVPGALLGEVELPGPAGTLFVVRDYLASLAPGEPGDPVAGDDAADVRWVGDAQAARMDARGELTRGLLVTLRGWCA